MSFPDFAPDSPYYLSPLFPELDEIQTTPPMDKESQKPQPQPRPQPILKSSIDRERTKSLFPLVTPERRKTAQNDEKRTQNWQKKWEERKLQEIAKEEKRRIDFQNRLSQNGIIIFAKPV